jgi:hypothetical protein
LATPKVQAGNNIVDPISAMGGSDKHINILMIALIIKREGIERLPNSKKCP